MDNKSAAVVLSSSVSAFPRGSWSFFVGPPGETSWRSKRWHTNTLHFEALPCTITRLGEPGTDRRQFAMSFHHAV
jgi:hypothetical protein